MPSVNTTGLSLRSRGQTYTLLVGVVVGLLVAGLGIPFVFGTPLSEAGQATPEVDDAGLAGDQSDAETAIDGGEQAAPATSDEDDAGDQQAPDRAADGASADQGPPDGSGAAPEPEVAEPSDEGGGDGAGQQEAALSATDRGVTEEHIRLGLLVLDVGNLGEIGVGVPGIDPEEQKEAWQAYVDHVNEAGGIHGRQIEPIYESYDPLDADSMRAACLAVTQDGEAFAVLDSGGMSGSAINCVTDENDTTMITGGTQGTTTEMHRRAPDRLFSLLKSSHRLSRNVAHELDQMGELDGRTLGVTVSEHESQVADQLEDALADQGHDVAYTAEFARDYSQGSSQVPVEVQQMRTNGVDLVVHLVNVVYATQFVQTADSQNYHPQYVSTNWRNGNNDVYADGMPDSYDGTIVLTSLRVNEARAGLPEAESAVSCRERYEEATGKEIERDANDYGAYMIYCDALDVFVRGAQQVGPELTMDALAPALRGLDPFPLAASVGGTFGDDKPDAADYMRTMLWKSDCRCVMPQDDWRETRY